ncbi:tetratricopeptide repeat protein [Jiangella gansuensis]|uniref:tetratricopeptide repeat protein n=1 Tax=Jiangella gansuensis TaxID=281473 RepID=UPI00047CD542|nr:tetratricopeptide repeat protein [Jiangella gansuensis]
MARRLQGTGENAATVVGADVGVDADRRWTLERLALELRSMRSAAGHPSYAEIARRIAAHRAGRGVPPAERRPARATVYDCFRTDRRRVDVDLVVDIVRALGASESECAWWVRACSAAQRQADAATVVSVHADLPAAVDEFVGRDRAVDLIVSSGAAGTGPRLFSIEGLAGAGKTQLAVRAARRLVDRGDVDAAIVADLRGFDRDSPPADPYAVMAACLRVLGVPARQIPADSQRRSALFAERLRDRRCVVILDDAADADQVRPLLPDAHDGVVLITSRTAVSELIGAVPVALGALSTDESVSLLRQVAGAELVEADPDAAADLVEESGGLPLAVGLTATRVAARPGWSLRDHVAVLRERRRTLRLDDAVRASLDLSYSALPASARAVVRLLAVHPCDDLDLPSIAALTGRELADVRGDVDDLTRHHLLDQPRPGRYAMHALVRTYALDRSHDEDRPADRRDAMLRLCDHVAAMVWGAYHASHRAEGEGPRRHPARLTVPALSEDDARTWLSANLATILTLAGHGSDTGRDGLVVELSEGAASWLNTFGHYREARLLHQMALDHATTAGDRPAAARARLDLGMTLVRLSENALGSRQLHRALNVFDDMGDVRGAGVAMNALAIIDVHEGRLDDAIERFQRAGEYARAAGDGVGIATALDNTAIVLRRAGRLDEAAHHHELGLQQAELIGDTYRVSTGMINLAEVQLLLDRPEDALTSAGRGLELARALANAPAIAYGNDNLATVLSTLGDHAAALTHYEEALALSRDIGDRHLEAGVLNNIGTASFKLGDVERARSHHSDALIVSSGIDDDFEKARALGGLGAVLAAGDDVDEARRMWTDSLAIFERLGAPEATDIRDCLNRFHERPEA